MTRKEFICALILLKFIKEFDIDVNKEDEPFVYMKNNIDVTLNKRNANITVYIYKERELLILTIFKKFPNAYNHIINNLS